MKEPKKPSVYVDMSKLSEDERIMYMGQTVVQSGMSVWVLTDDEPGKIERYKEKMKKHFPDLVQGEIRRGFPREGAGGFTLAPPPHDS